MPNALQVFDMIIDTINKSIYNQHTPTQASGVLNPPHE